jgi:DNA-binding transcriptional regulator LsrR (DeoR family)
LRIPNSTGLKFISLAGSLLRNSAANPYDIVQMLARNVEGEAYFLPSPFTVDRRADVSVILAQRIVQEALRMAREAAFYIVGASDCSRDSTIFKSGLVTEDDLQNLQKAKVTCETTGVFFDSEGQFVETDLGARTIGISYEDLANHEVILIAAGRPKAPVIRSLSKSRVINCLITDGDTAADLLSRTDMR